MEEFIMSELSLEIIQQWLKDSDWRVRTAAMNACETMGISIPAYRSIEPPKKVYKKCVGDVIVVATIPDDAEIRGQKDGKCRTNKAKIIDIIGEFGGKKLVFQFGIKRLHILSVTKLLLTILIVAMKNVALVIISSAQRNKRRIIN